MRGKPGRPRTTGTQPLTCDDARALRRRLTRAIKAAEEAVSRHHD